MNGILERPLPQALSWADTQLKIIGRQVMEYQASLDQEHDVALLLTHFGQSVLMEVEQVYCDGPVLMIFRGKVEGKDSVLIQHVTQLSFLLTSVSKEPNAPKRKIGFSAD